jgi:spore maturation protein CgeB
MLTENLSIVKEKFPALVELIEQAGPEEGTEYFAARNGQISAKIEDRALGSLTLYSSIEPERAAKRDVERWHPGNVATIVVLGVGLGYHLFALADRFPGSRIVAIESRPGLLRKSMETYDWTRMLSRPGFTLAEAGASAQALRSVLRGPTTAVFTHPVLFKLDMSTYYPIRKELTVGRGAFGRLRILSFIARGDLVPYTLADIHDTLRDMGHEVHAVDITTVTRVRELSDAVRTAAESFQPDLIVTMGAVGLCEDVAGRLGVPIAAWFMDDPFGQLAFKEGEDGPRPEMLGADFHAFSWDEHYVTKMAERGIRAHYLPLATNPKVHFPRPSNLELEAHYGADISFVGTADRDEDKKYRLAYIGALDGLDVALWGGPGWQLLQGPGFRYRGRADNRIDAPFIYSLSKINLNLTANQLVTALSIRIFDILACGGFLLTDARADLKRLFNPGSDLVVFQTKTEMRSLVQHYIDNPEEREKIAQRGRRTVLARHTFAIRLEEMLGVVFSDS